MTLDDRIDELYRLPLSEFTAARNALAKSVARTDEHDEAKRIRSLAKPTTVPWAVNQLFWHARLVYERLMRGGETIRAAQLGALNRRAQSKPADVKRAADAHRASLAEAVRQATRLAGAAGFKPDLDELSRTLESLSLAPSRSKYPGRLTEPVQPAGFEALAGVSTAASSVFAASPRPGSKESARAGADSALESEAPRDKSDAKRAAEAKRARAEAAAERQRDKELTAQKRKAQAALGAAERDFARTKAAEAQARDALDRAERAREEAHERLVAARKFVAANF